MEKTNTAVREYLKKGPLIHVHRFRYFFTEYEPFAVFPGNLLFACASLRSLQRIDLLLLSLLDLCYM